MEIVPARIGNEDGGEGPASTAALLLPNPRKLIRFVPSLRERNGISAEEDQTSLQPHLLVYIPTSNVQTSFFILYSLTVDMDGNLTSITPIAEKPCDFAIETASSSFSSSSISSQLCDFLLLPPLSGGQPTLWTVWNENGQAVLRFSALSLAFDALITSGNGSEGDDAGDGIAVQVAGSPPSSWTTVSPSPSQLNTSLDAASESFDERFAQFHAQAILDGQAESCAPYETIASLILQAKHAVGSSFLSHIFHPGRYAASDIVSALLAYVRQVPKSQQNLSALPEGGGGGGGGSTSLAQQALDVVGCSLTVLTDAQTGALQEQEYLKAVKLEWLRFLALCEERRRDAGVPVALALCGRGSGQDAYTEDLEGVMVLAKGAVGMPAKKDSVLLLSDAAKSENGKGAANVIPEAADSPKRPKYLFLASIALFKSLFRKDAASTKSAVLAEFEDAAREAVTTSLEITREDVAASIYERFLEPFVDDALHMAVSDAVERVAGQGSLCDTFLAAFQILFSRDGTPDLHTDHMEEEASDVPQSALLQALLVDLSSIPVFARYELSLALFLLVLFVQGEMLHPDSGSDRGAIVSEEEMSEVLEVAFESLRSCSTGKWIAEHNLAMTDLEYRLPQSGAIGGGDATGDLMDRLQSLQVQSPTAIKRRAQRPVCSVLAGLATHPRFSPSLSLSSIGPNAFSQASQSFIGLLGFLSPAGLDDDHAAHIVASLKDHHFSSEALAVINMLTARDENAALLHLHAVIAAEKNDIGTAEKAFVKVAGAICELVLGAMRTRSYRVFPLNMYGRHQTQTTSL